MVEVVSDSDAPPTPTELADDPADSFPGGELHPPPVIPQLGGSSSSASLGAGVGMNEAEVRLAVPPALQELDEVEAAVAARGITHLVDHQRTGSQRLMLFPWVTNPWLREVFGPPKDVDAFPEPLVPVASFVPQVPSGPPPELGHRILRAKPKKRKQAKPWIDVVDEARQAALSAWNTIITGRESLSKIGKQMVKATTEEDRMQILMDTVADKATGTLRARAYYFSKYLVWAESGSDAAGAVTENLVYEYCRFLRLSGSAATSATRFKETVAFVSGVLGWEVEKEALDSRRASGVAVSMMKTLGPVKRATPFSYSFLSYLEKLLADKDEAVEVRYVASVVLFLIHTRSRFSDAMRIGKEPVIERGVLMTEVSKYKTAGAKERRGLALPVCAISKGVADVEWAEHFLAVRHEIGIKASPVAPFFPELKEGKPTLAGISLEERTTAIRRLVKLHHPEISEESLSTYSTHSCKRTLLYWAALDGLSLDSRRLLGGHVVKSDGSWLAYSVEALAGPLKELASTLSRFGKEVDEPKAGQVVEDDPSSSTSESEVSSGADTKKMVSSVASISSKAETAGPLVLDGYETYRHHKYGTVHLRMVGATTLRPQFLCGRKTEGPYSQTDKDSHHMRPRCATCFAKI